MKEIKTYFKNAPKIMKVLRYTSTIFSLLFFTASFILPPLGVVDQSVLLASSELDTSVAIFCGILTIYQGRNMTIKKGDLHIETKEQDNNQTD